MINGFKKEFLFFLRGGRLIAAVLVMIGLALMSPISFGLMAQTMQAVEAAIPDEEYTQIVDMFTSFTASDMLMYNVEYVAGIGAIVMLFLFKGAAGGEQARRSVIIPRCSGLDAERYTLPKFLIYPFSIAIVSALAVALSAAVSGLMFPGGLDWGMVWLSAACTAVYLAFYTSLQFCIGICTGKANLAVVIAIVMQMFLPSMLSLFRVDRFNPLALYTIALGAARDSGAGGSALLAAVDSTSVSNDMSVLNISVSIATAVVFSVLLYFLTLYVQHTREVRNEGDEPVL